MPRIAMPALLALSLIALAPSHARAQSTQSIDSLRRELNELREGQMAILRELREMRMAPAAPKASATAPTPTPLPMIDVSGPALGSPNARVTVIEFSDYQCPFCGRFYKDSFQRLSAEYIKTGRVRYVMKDFPIETLHPLAVKAAEATHCAGDQGKFWAMHDRLFEYQQGLSRNLMDTHAASVGLNVREFQRCVDGGTKESLVRRGIAEGESVGVSGTPAFFIAITKPGETELRPLFVVRGAKSYADFKRYIDAALATAP